MRSHLAYLTVAFLAFAPATASASVVDYIHVGTNLNMGTLVAGQTGSISYTAPGAALHITQGLLAANTSIVFSYSFSGKLRNYASSLTAAGYNYTMGGNHYLGLATSVENTPPVAFLNGETSHSWVNGSASTALLFATANLTKGEKTGSLTITNKSLGIASFINTLTLLFSNPSIHALTYAVTPLSAVPLPATLPMFASLLAGLFGMRRFRRKVAA